MYMCAFTLYSVHVIGILPSKLQCKDFIFSINIDKLHTII